MSKTQQIEQLWKVLESRDLSIFKAQQRLTKLTEIETENARLKGDVEQLRKEFKVREDLIQELYQEIHELTVNLQISETQQESLKHVIQQREESIEDLKGQLQLSEDDRLVLHQKIDQLQEQINDKQATIEGMESSKFWQLRNQFLDLKKSLGLKGEE